MGGAFDAIIVGGGHNGLVTAAYLARAGRSVLVLEKRAILGGACVTEEIHPGFRGSTTSYVCSLLRPAVVVRLLVFILVFAPFRTLQFFYLVV